MDRNTGSTVGFGFAVPPLFALVPPWEASTALIIQTDAAQFTVGQATVIDGKAITVSAFGPAVTTAVPEPATLSLLGLGLAGVGFMGRRRKN